ncbi:MAG: hypothetical protein M1822_001549 [Bathelium mastoideum]|nr:MAG: hypothetical protein M1822_001549 [Bathelium mastoideum]
MQVAEHMTDLIDQYFQDNLFLSQEEANQLHTRYYRDYGLAIEGLVRFHKVDPLEYNSRVDDALPLEDIIRPDPKLRQLLLDMDTTKVKLWLFTNAYITHGKRVVKLLGVDDLFEGITYCDYAAEPLLCKPHADMFRKAQREANVTSPNDCYFVDDSAINLTAGEAFGWTCIHLLEPQLPQPETKVCQHQIQDLEGLRYAFPQFFKKTSNGV